MSHNLKRKVCRVVSVKCDNYCSKNYFIPFPGQLGWAVIRNDLHVHRSYDGCGCKKITVKLTKSPQTSLKCSMSRCSIILVLLQSRCLFTALQMCLQASKWKQNTKRFFLVVQFELKHWRHFSLMKEIWSERSFKVILCNSDFLNAILPHKLLIITAVTQNNGNGWEWHIIKVYGQIHNKFIIFLQPIRCKREIFC